MHKIKLALADDHTLFRKGLATFLAMIDDFEIVGEANNGKELLELMAVHPADVVLMDMEMDEMDGLEATRQLKASNPQIHVIIISAYDEDQLILDAVELGAKGYLLKDSDPDEVEDAVRSVVQNGFYFNDDVSKIVLKGVVQKDKIKSRFETKESLTDRELGVVKLVCQELTNAEIAERLFLSPRTVESYRKRIIEKIGVRNTAGMVVYALKNNLVDF